jgi:hypothetical protein
MKKYLLFTIAWAAVLPAFSHAGHGHESPLSPKHYVANPEHALQLTVGLGVCIVLITWISNWLQQKMTKK